MTGRHWSIRAATLDDVAQIRSILAEHGNDGPIENADIVGPYVAHLVTNGRALVADEDHGLVAFGATVATGRGRHLADLFVRTDQIGRGIGRSVLDAAFGDDWPRTTFASDDPRALPLYIRAGMLPLGICLYLEGPAASIPRLDGDLAVEPADPSRVADLEREWTGIDRSVDHAYWASQADSDVFVIVDARRAIAVGHARARQVGRARALNRLVVAPAISPVPPILAALRRAARGGPVMATFLGANAAVRPLLDGGFRIVDRDTFMASEPGLVDPDRLLPNSGLL